MKAKINHDNSHGGNWDDSFLKANIDNKIKALNQNKAQLVSTWVLTYELPKKELVKPMFDNRHWIEGSKTN